MGAAQLTQLWRSATVLADRRLECIGCLGHRCAREAAPNFSLDHAYVGATMRCRVARNAVERGTMFYRESD